MRDMIRGIEPLANVLWVGLFKIAAQVVVSSKGRNHKGLVLTMPSVVLVGANTGSAEIATPSTGLTALRLGDRSEGGNGFCGLGSGRQRWMKAPPLTRRSCSGMPPEISDWSESLGRRPSRQQRTMDFAMLDIGFDEGEKPCGHSAAALISGCGADGSRSSKLGMGSSCMAARYSYRQKSVSLLKIWA